MRQEHIKAILEGVVPVVRDAIAAAMRPLLDRIDALEKRSPEKGVPGVPGERGEKGADGADGKDGMDGRDGADGKDGTPGLPGEKGDTGEAGPRGEAGPQGERGEKGEKGDVGAAGKDGAPGERGADGAAGRDGVAGKDGAPGPQGERGEKGADGIDGKDGASVSLDDVEPLIADHVAKAVAALPPAKDGRDGRDASDIPMLKSFIVAEVRDRVDATFRTVAFDSPDSGRTLVFSFDVGGESIRHPVKTALVLDRGVWRAGPFVKGDGVSFGGSFFIAQDDTEDKPETSNAWRLAVKRGRNGSDGAPGKDGVPGRDGKDGVPGRDGGSF